MAGLPSTAGNAQLTASMFETPMPNIGGFYSVADSMNIESDPETDQILERGDRDGSRLNKGVSKGKKIGVE